MEYHRTNEMAAIPIVDLTELGITFNYWFMFVKCYNHLKANKFLTGDVILEENVNNSNLIVKQLDDAFSTVGFVYLINHGIDQTKVKYFLIHFDTNQI